jgi:PIN domain nuclease of toxin-antitoxin system
LLDSHPLIWAAGDLLDDRATELISDARAAVAVSAATIWELEIKRSLGRLISPPDVLEMVEHSGFEPLAITFEHAVEAARLPLHHRDPFDRMLVAQARLEGLTLVTCDSELLRYDVATVEVARA